ncbi:MAG: hypothetical protein AABY32_05070 [Nanoarchaeota archaeon]
MKKSTKKLSNPMLRKPQDTTSDLAGVVLESAKIEDVAADKAESMLSLKWIWQRPVKGARVDGIVYRINRPESSGWMDGSVIILAYVEETGEWYLIDGQHRLIAVVKTNKSVRFTVLRYKCKTLASAMNLTATQDNPESSRSIGDAAAMSGLVDVPAKILSSMVGTVVNASTHCAFSPKVNGFMSNGNLEKIHIMERFYNDAKWFQSLTYPYRNASKIYSKGVKPCILASSWVNKKEATSFWNNYFSGSELRPSDPRLLLREYILLSQTNFVRGIDTLKNSFGRAVRCWNCYFLDVPFECTDFDNFDIDGWLVDPEDTTKLVRPSPITSNGELVGIELEKRNN